MSEKYIGSALVVVTTAIAFAIVRKRWSLTRPPYPPGPKGYPVIGNVFDFPRNPIWEGFTKMAQEHGEWMVGVFKALMMFNAGGIADSDILYLDVMGTPIVVLSNNDMSADLLERRSVSDRVRKPFNTQPRDSALTDAHH